MKKLSTQNRAVAKLLGSKHYLCILITTIFFVNRLFADNGSVHPSKTGAITVGHRGKKSNFTPKTPAKNRERQLMIAPPAISYDGPQAYVTNTPISPLAPQSSGVAAQAYGKQVVIGTMSGYSTSLTVDAAGNVYYIDYVVSQLIEIPAGGGSPVNIGSGLAQPLGLALRTDGTFYVSDPDTIKTIVSGGRATVIHAGTPYPHTYFQGMTADLAGNIYIADRGKNNAIEELPGGSNTGFKTVATGFNAPYDVAVDAAGNIYVTDSGNDAVKMIPVGGGAPVTLCTGFTGLQGITVDALANVYFTDVATHSVYELPKGSNTPVLLLSTFNYPSDVAIDGKGVIYVDDEGGKVIKRFTPVGGYYINALPAGLNFDQTTGTISGTPTVSSPATTYTVTAYNAGGGTSAQVNISVASNVNLSGLALSSGTLTPAFSPGTTAYSANVITSATTINITPTAADLNSTIKINGDIVPSGSASSPIKINAGSNNIPIVITGKDGVSTKTYTVTVSRPASTNALLSKLSTTPGTTLTVVSGPSFKNYTTSVPSATTSIIITPTASDVNATITVNGVAVASGTASPAIPLAVGQNTINTVVTAENGVATNTYTITVTRPISTDATLASLTAGSATLTPAFAPGTTSYAGSVANTTASITVTATASASASTITINGVAATSGVASGAIPLNVGSNTITTVVTAQNGTTTKTYTITITRAVSDNAFLSKLSTVPGVALTVVSGPGYQNYTGNVPNGTASIQVRPTTQDAGATVQVNGTTVASGTPSGAIALNAGANTINVVVTAADNTTTKTYIITLTRAAGPVNIPDAMLSMIDPARGETFTGDGINVHQGLTPNGDGINDVFTIEGIANYPDNKLIIMNRNGGMVFEAKGYDNVTRTFDGHSNKTGALQLPGTYFYSLDYMAEGVMKHKTGFIVLKY